MSSHFDSLLERTIKLAQDLAGGVVAGAVERAKQKVVRNVTSLAVGAAALVVALVFGAIGFNRWLETIIDANHRWAPPAIVGLVCAVVGLAVLRSARGRGES